MERHTGLFVIAIGVGVVVLGVAIWSGALGWFGRLPGDLRFESGRTRVFIPITSMVIASIVLTVIANVIRRLR